MPPLGPKRYRRRPTKGKYTSQSLQTKKKYQERIRITNNLNLTQLPPRRKKRFQTRDKGGYQKRLKKMQQIKRGKGLTNSKNKRQMQ